mmetsp:Transcript_31361/g.46877  ORF Transcript_31361/g.46877 Transcript_31361/m.46877 type:complete len:91 (+) Transcript_31361:153-425(+)
MIHSNDFVRHNTAGSPGAYDSITGIFQIDFTAVMKIYRCNHQPGRHTNVNAKCTSGDANSAETLKRIAKQLQPCFIPSGFTLPQACTGPP